MIRRDIASEELVAELETLRRRVAEFETVSSERKQAEKQVRESEQNLKTYFDNAPDGIYLSDLKGVFLYGNKRAEEILGYKKEELIGNNFLKLTLLPKKYLAKAGQLLALNLIGKNTGPDEFELVRKDNSVCWVEINTSPIKQKDKRIVIGFVRDITDRKQTEKLLHESEAKYRLIVEKSQDVLFTFNIAGEFLYVSPSVKNILGYNPSDLIGHTFGSLVHPEDMPGLQLAIQLNIKNGSQTPGGNRYRVRHANGEWRWHNAAGNAIFDANGNFLHFVAISRDITEHQQAEEALKVSEQNFRNSMDSSLMGIRIVDEEWHTLYANQVFLDIFGYKTSDEVSRNALQEHYTPQEYARYLLRQEKRIRGEIVPDNTKVDIISENGSLRHLEIYSNQVFWGGKKRREIIYNDVTERKRAEEALIASEEKYSTLIEQSADGIVILNVHKIEFVNRKMNEMFGFAQAEILGKHFHDLVAPEYKKMLIESDNRKRILGVPNTLELGMLCKDGRRILADTRSLPIVYKDRPARMVIIRDITERKLAEEALKASEENFRNSMDNTLVGIRISDIDNHTLYANQALLDIYGYKNIDEVKAKSPQEYYSPESYAEYLAMREKYGRGQIIPDQVDIDIVRKDGTMRHLQAFFKVMLWDGQKQFQTLYNDITERKKVEEALYESEEKYRLIVENTRDFIFSLNAAGEYVYVSPSVQTMLGYKPTDLIGETFISLVHPKDKNIIEEETQRGTAGGYQISQNNEYRIRHASGEWRWVVSNGTRAVDANGNFLYFIGIARDITENKQAEEALKASEQNFRNSLDSSSIGIRIMGDANYTLYANQALLDMFSYKNIEELRVSPPQEHYTPESYAVFVQRKERFSRGESLPDQLEIDIIRKDGAIRHLQLSSKEVLWDGKMQYQLLYNDITEQKEALERIEQAAQEWRTTFDSITDLISIHDKDNRIIRVNQAMADLLNTKPKELVGKYCYEVMHGTQECPTNCPHMQTLKTGKSAVIETFDPNLGRHFQESASPLFNEKGEITGTVLVARDVTQQKRMEEQLIMTDRLASIGELSSGIAHELNNPLTSVIGFSQLLMEGDVPDNMKEDLGTVYSEAQRAAAIVKNLLTFARKHAPVKSLSQVNTVIEDVLRLRAYEQKVNNIEIENRLAANLPEIMIDHFQMQQVFLNIMVNAEFAMLEAHHKGKLIITTEKIDGVIKITFADDGPGIDKENLKHIFDPFFTTKEVGKGTGLGLSICHGIVTEHGGKIYASSVKGQGATFTIELPLINEQ